MKLKVCTVFGTRPECIKMAPVVLRLEAAGEVEQTVVVTGQHREMLDQMLEIFEITPNHDLEIMEARQSLTRVTVKTLESLEGVLRSVRPDVVLVHGDTTTSFAGALAAYYSRTPVGHVEAGLRTGDPYNPYPEEMNRRLIDHLSELLLAPTAGASDALIAENLDPGKIYVTGNTVVDALLIAVRKARPDPGVPEIPEECRMILVEAHRRENWGEPLRGICEALKEITAAYRDAHVVFPVHLNPVVRETVFDSLNGAERIHLLEPQSYLSFVHLMNRSYMILTDSGGIQEEAPSLRKPVVVLRTKTERPEALEAKTAVLAGTEKRGIVEHVSRLMDDEAGYEEMTRGRNPYGDGRAAERSVGAVLHRFGVGGGRPDDFAG
ncbi:MAG: UDP-N-acetylglucosamine 2-epimerase (non-hydrolyzing) [bacterium]